MSRRHALIGASKPYLYKEEDAEFYYRQTSGGVIMNNSPLVGSIDRIKGQTIAWNQIVMNGNFINTDNWVAANGLGITVSNNVASLTFTNRNQGIYCNIGVKAIHKYYITYLERFVSGEPINIFERLTLDGARSDVTAHSVSSSSFVKRGVVMTSPEPGAGSADRFYIFSLTNITNNSVIEIKNVNIIDLALIYGAGNEPSTPEQFEADYQRWFGKPLTYEPYDEGSLRNVQMGGIKTTFTNASPQTRNFDVTTLTGKLNGEGESVVIFPDGMKGVNDVKDEIYVEDGVTKAVKRIGRVDLGSLSWVYVTTTIDGTPFFKATISARKGGSNIIKCAKYSLVGNDKTALIGKDKSMAPYNAVSKSFCIVDSSYTDADTFKTAMSGVYLDYELAEPQVYVLDTPLPIVYNCEANGTEQILPEEIGTGIAPIMDITYKIGQINN